MMPALRGANAADLPALRALYAAAFPEEDLTGLVAALAVHPSRLASPVAVGTDGILAGHAHLTRCAVAGWGGLCALLGPVAVAPGYQRRGVGGALVKSALDVAESRGVEPAGRASDPGAPADAPPPGLAGHGRASGMVHVLVLGDPGYYGRFGFRPEGHVLPPYPLPPDWSGAWQGLTLGAAGDAGQGAGSAGRLEVPGPWRRKALWSP